MNNIEKINKINKSLIEVRERFELEIDELVQFELRKMVDIFNNDNKNFCELYHAIKFHSKNNYKLFFVFSIILSFIFEKKLFNSTPC